MEEETENEAGTDVPPTAFSKMKNLKGGNMEEEEKSIMIKKSDLWKYSTFLLVAVVLIGAFFMFAGNGTPTGNTVQQPTGQDTGNGEVSVNLEKLIQSDTPIIGSADAPVTIVEFSDFSCPYCAAASGDNAELVSYMQQRDPSWEPIITNLMEEIQAGKVRLAVKYTVGHSGGHPAQLVAWCLNDQDSDLYWKFYPKAFANQNDVEDISKMTTLAKSIGADMTKLQTCIDSKKYDSRFDQEQNEGSKQGIRGTPAFLVGKTGGDTATIVSGAVSYTNFKQIIDSL